MDKRLTKKELDKVRKRLPNGAVEQIARETGLKESSVKQILLKPERFNKRVLGIAISLAVEETQEITEMKNTVKAIA